MRSNELWSTVEEVASERLSDALESAQIARALFSLEGLLGEKRHRLEMDFADWAGRVRDVQAGESSQAQAEALHRVLVDELGFRGAVSEPYGLDSVRLSKVIQERRGAPSVLSAIWMEVGRRAGYEVDGLVLPGYSLARVGGVKGALIDPYAGGCCTTEAHCAALVGELSNNVLLWDEHYLEAVALDVMVERVLRVQMSRLRGIYAPVLLYRAMRMHTVLRPNEPEPALVLARMAEKIGAYIHAAELYRGVIQRWPETPESRVADRHLELVLWRVDRLH